MSPLSRRELLDLAARQQVEGIDLVERIVALIPSGEQALTPDPFPKGRGEEGPTREEATPGRQRLRARPV